MHNIQTAPPFGGLSLDELAKQFKAIKSRDDCAALLGVKLQNLTYILHILAESRRYRRFSIKKKRGGERTINAPCFQLRRIQQRLNSILQVVYGDRSGVHGGIPGRSIMSNAAPHVNRRFVFNIDLSNFFPSIGFGRVWGMLKAKPYSLPPDAAQLIANICCFQKSLPQGAPTSPVIANMVCSALDSRLKKLAAEHRCTFSRYFDDITFSTNLRRFPPALAVASGGSVQVEVGAVLKTAIEDAGFAINPEKVRLYRYSQRQEVTGLTINRRINLPRRFPLQIRAMLNAWENFGLVAAAREHWVTWRKSEFADTTGTGFRNVVKGKLAYLGMVRGKDDEAYLKLLRKYNILSGITVPNTMTQAFISYSHKDHLMRKKLENHLAQLRNDKLLSTWCDHEILPGALIDDVISATLGTSRLILCLISADFLASNYCYHKELKKAIEMHEAGLAIVVPIIVRPCDWQSSPLGKLLALPKDGKPISDFRPHDKGFTDVARALRTLLQATFPK